jgi:hypothetical protein
MTDRESNPADLKREQSGGPSASTAGTPAPLAVQLGVVTVFLIVVLYLLYVVLTVPEPTTISKAELKGDIVTAIKNNADLRAIKQIYNNRHRSAGWGFVGPRTHYAFSVPLSAVLEDVRADVFLAHDSDKSLLPALDKLTAEQFQTNPFDTLEPDQKDHFERLRERLGERYAGVQDEVGKIADQLYAKNILTQQYLRNSTISVWVSVVGLLFAIVVGSVQLYQGRTARLNNALRAALHSGEKSAQSKIDAA